MGLSAFFAFSVNAQTQIKLKTTPNRGELKNNVSAKVSPSNSTQQITGSISCLTQYVASSTMDLLFEIDLTNTDSEYGDLVTITFPAGITPNTNAANTPSIGTGGSAEVLNPISGQSISWGDNDNNFGGVVPGTTYTVSVNVTIGALTGNQTASYSVSGDTYGAGPGDLTGGSCIIFPAGATVVNMQTKLMGVITNTVSFDQALAQNCSMGMGVIVSQIHNLGTNSESNIPVNYSVNGVASSATTYTGTIAPGDSALVLFPIPYNFAPQDVYNVKTWTALAGDIALANDTTTFTLTNSLPVALTNTANVYSNGFETAYEQSSANLDWLGLGLPFGLSANSHTGTRALFYTVPTAAPTGTYAAMINLPCVDVVIGETYRISYWRKTISTPAANGMSGIFTGLGQNSTDMNVVLKPYSTITPTTAAGPWEKDSVDYVATATETRYFGIGGMGTVSASSQINVRIDDILIKKVTSSVGIKENTLNVVSIFPNPSNGVVTLNAIEANSSVEVYNIIGENVFTKSVLVKGSNTLDLSNLAAGSYIVKVKTGNEVATKRIVISK